MSTTCPSCGSCERVSRVTGTQSVVKCGCCGRIHQMLLHPRPVLQPSLRAEVRAHPHYYISVMLAFLAGIAVLLFVQLL